MRKYFIILLLLIALPCWGADIHICDTAVCGQEPGDGSTWSNALDDFPASLVRGDTYYIADGNYPGYTFKDAVDGTKVITVKKATASDHGTDIGWQSIYGDGQAVFQYPVVTKISEKTGISILTSYITFDGSVGSGGNISSYGFRVKNPGDMGKEGNVSTLRSDISGIGLPQTGYSTLTVSNIKVRHVAIEGPGSIPCNDGIPYACPNSGVFSNSSNASNIEIANNYLFGWQTQTNFFRAQNITIHDNYFDSNTSGTAGHGQQMNVDGTNNVAIYNNVFRNSKAYIMGAHGNVGPNRGLSMYNNLSYGYQGEQLSGCFVVGGAGAPDSIWGANFHNNTFVDLNCGAKGAIFVGNLSDVATQKSYAYNNLFYNVVYPRMDNIPLTFTAGAVVHDNNAYLACTGTLNNADETYPQVDAAATSAIFTNYATGDYTIAATNQTAIDHIIGKGTTLASPFDIDILGVSRTAPFDIGAYDVGGEADTTDPILAEVTPVTTPSPNQAPSYVFSSDEAGTVTYGGTCGNGTLSTAVVGNNTVEWNLGIGTYSNCTITVTDAALNASSALSVTEFVITPTDATAVQTISGGVSFNQIP